MLLNIERLGIINNLLQAINILETDLTIFTYFKDDFTKKWPEIRKIFSATTLNQEIDLVLIYSEILNSEESGELQAIETLISSYLEQMPSPADIDLFKKQVRNIQMKLFKKFMDLIII